VAALTFSLVAIAFVVAWLTYRVERASARRRDIAAAQAVLGAVRRGLVLGMPGLGEEYQGWGRLYFARSATGATALQAGSAAQRLVESGGSYQAYRVPVAPLERLATTRAAGSLVSEETVVAANLALWRLGVFNHLVDKQTSFNVAHAVEIADGTTPTERRRAISVAAGGITTALHLDGIGRAADEGGWYRRLTDAVAADIRRLAQMRSSPWWRSYAGAWHLLAGDLLAVAACAGLLALAGVRLHDAVTDDGSAPARPASTNGRASTSSTSSSSVNPHITTVVRSVRGSWP
jgi:hypothetical protein